jgi:DNA repair protein RadC
MMLPNYSHFSVQRLPENERPRERMMRFGPESLSAAELIAIILGSGTKTMPVLQLAQEILIRFGSLSALADATIEELCQIKGVGLAKAIQLRASLNLGQRASNLRVLPKSKIEHPSHIYHLLKDALQHEKREHFIAILLNVKCCIICHQVVAIGTLSNAPVHPREVFYFAVRHKAASLILAHNHPSGDLAPSEQDCEVTEHLMEVGEMMGIPVKDHIIISERGFLSMRQQGILFDKD